MANKTFLYNVDTEEVSKLMKETEENSAYFDEVVKKVANEQTRHLDELMQKAYKAIKSPEFVSDAQLERYCAELTNLLYFMGDKLEKLGVYADVSKAAYREVYNNFYLDNQIKDSEKRNKTTVAENQAVAEQSSKYESVVSSMYERAHKIVKYKVDAGYEMVNTLRKQISRRMKEQDLSMYSTRTDFSSTEEY